MSSYDNRTIARFNAKVDRKGPDECWPWKAGHFDSGYGAFYIARPKRNHGAHVISYLINRGQTAGLFVCHSCDNKGCVNPAHLFLGTPLGNMQDKVSKGRQLKGSRCTNSKLTEPDVHKIRSLLNEGQTNRAIAAQFGVTPEAISAIRVGHSWKWVEKAGG